MKKILKMVIVIIVIFLALWGIEFGIEKSRDDVEEKFSSTEGITTALTLEDEIQNDTIWCGTFQLIWNDMKNDIIKGDIEFEPQLKVVENLNKETFKEEDISEEYYYKKLGTPSHELKEEIAKAIKDKFNETSEILDDFNWENKESNDYFLYAMLKKEFQFEKAFEELENGEYIVSGPDVDRLMSRVNLADNESMYYFQKMLTNLGIEDALRKAGAKDGDTVRFNDWEFDWYN